MSIASEITRLQGAKADIKTAIEGKGVTVPSATKLDGYASLVSSIPSGGGSTLITKSISANGTYNASSDSADGYSQVTVAVPASAVDSGTKSITSNGTHDVVGYASASVAVPNSYSASDEGKVVSSGALVAQTSDTVTANDTYDTTLINSLTVNVSGGGSDEDAILAGTIQNYSNSTLTTLGSQAFRNSTAIKTVSFPNVTSVASEAFRGCSNLESISFPNATSIGGNTFMSCPKLTNPLVFNKLTSIINSTLSNIANVPAIDLPVCSSIIIYGFASSANMSVLVLRKSDSVVSLSNINAFSNTPFASGKAGGTLYVPQSLISSYQGASNWSTILGYATNSIKSIESTHTDPTAPIDLTLYYADGTPISS